MSTDGSDAREEITERRWLSTAGAAAHPALANGVAVKAETDQQNPPVLLRVPRASVPPPLSEGKTQLTPAPVFDDEVELLEDSGLLTLLPENAEPIEELSARFLIDEDAREVRQPTQAVSSDELAAMDELDSENLSFVETRGEIHNQELHSPATDGPKISLISLHEQALAEGIAQYSDGVPRHDLEGSAQLSRTLRVRALPRETHASPWRHLPLVLVFAAGVSAGIFVALQNTGSSQSPVSGAAANNAPLANASAAAVAPEIAAIGIAEPEVAHAVASEPVVSPLPDAPVLSGVQVMPLPASDEASPSPSPALVDEPRTKARAHIEQNPIRRGSRQPVTGTSDPGVLMLAAKPPCSIRIDGKDTGLVTPQRVLQLSPGKHKIVLVNEEHGLKDSFVVSIQSGEKTRVIRDNTSKIK